MPDDVIFPDQRDAGMTSAEEKKPKAKKAGSDSTKTLIFAAIACVVVSALLAFSQQALKGKIKSNKLAYQRVNIVGAFGKDVQDMDKAFKENIVTTYLDKDGKVIKDADPEDKNFKKQLKAKTALPVHAWYDDPEAAKAGGKADSYVIPVSGLGLWSVIYGYLGLEQDLKTIRAIRFYEQKETAGLGAECAEDWFMDQFKGKTLRDSEGGLADFKIIKGKKIEDLTENPHAVGGIAASTITSEGIQNFINKDVARYEPYFTSLLEPAAATP